MYHASSSQISVEGITWVVHHVPIPVANCTVVFGFGFNKEGTRNIVGLDEMVNNTFFIGITIDVGIYNIQILHCALLRLFRGSVGES